MLQISWALIFKYSHMSLGNYCSMVSPLSLSPVSDVLIQPSERFSFQHSYRAWATIYTETMLLIPLNGLLAPATNFHSLKLFIEFIYHLGYLQTAGVTPGPVVTSDGALPEPQLACVSSQMWKKSIYQVCTAQWKFNLIIKGSGRIYCTILCFVLFSAPLMVWGLTGYRANVPQFLIKFPLSRLWMFYCVIYFKAIWLQSGQLNSRLQCLLFHSIIITTLLFSSALRFFSSLRDILSFI